MAKKHGYRTEENFPGSEFTPDEWEFLRAMRDYQVKHDRRYPTYREVLEVLLGLGYRKVSRESSSLAPRADTGDFTRSEE